MSKPKEADDSIPTGEKPGVAEYLKKYYGSTMENSYTKRFQKKKPQMTRMVLKKKEIVEGKEHQVSSERVSSKNSFSNESNGNVIKNKEMITSFEDSQHAIQSNKQISSMSFHNPPKQHFNEQISKTTETPVSGKRLQKLTPKDDGRVQTKEFTPLPVPQIPQYLLQGSMRNVENQSDRPEIGGVSGAQFDSVFKSISNQNQQNQSGSQRSETFKQQLQEFQDLLNSKTSVALVKKCEEESLFSVQQTNEKFAKALQNEFNESLHKQPKLVVNPVPEQAELPLYEKPAIEPKKYEQLIVKSSNEELFGLMRKGREEKVSFSFGKNTSYQDMLSNYNSVKNSDFYKSNCSSNFNAFERFLKPLSFGGQQKSNYESLADSIRVTNDPIADINRRFDRIQNQTEALKTLAQRALVERKLEDEQNVQNVKEQGWEVVNLKKQEPNPQNVISGAFIPKQQPQNQEQQFSFESGATRSVNDSLSKQAGSQQYDTAPVPQEQTAKGDFSKKQTPIGSHELPEILTQFKSEGSKAHSLMAFASESRRPPIVQQIKEFESKQKGSLDDMPAPALSQLISFSSAPKSNHQSVQNGIPEPEFDSRKDKQGGLVEQHSNEPKRLINNFYLNENNKFSFKDNLLEQALEEMRPHRKHSENDDKRQHLEHENEGDEQVEVEAYSSDSPRPLRFNLKPGSLNSKDSFDKLNVHEIGQTHLTHGSEGADNNLDDLMDDSVPAPAPKITRALQSVGPADAQLRNNTKIRQSSQPPTKTQQQTPKSTSHSSNQERDWTKDQQLNSFLEKLLDKRASKIQRAWREYKRRTTAIATVSVNSLFNKFLEIKDKEKLLSYSAKNVPGSCQTGNYSLTAVSKLFTKHIKQEANMSVANAKKIKEVFGFVTLIGDRLQVFS